jgi:acetylornithine deacetylase/succinyl-diaminopimelate desuccinylase-like protein
MLRPAPIDPQTVVELAKDMIRFPSYSGDEGPLCAFLGERLSRLAFDEVELQTVTGARANVIARIRGDGSGLNLLFNGHLDIGDSTKGWTRDPFTPFVEDGVLIGAGLQNMKGAVAAMIAAADAIGRSGARPAGDIVVSAVIGEGREQGLGTKEFLSYDRTADAGINGEPTNFVLQTGHGGRYQFEIVNRGVERHISAMEHGVDALKAMARFVLDFDAAQLTGAPHPSFPDLPRVVIGQLEAGTWPQRVPGFCKAAGAVSFPPGMTAESIKRDIRRVLAAIAEKDPAMHLDFTINTVTYQLPFLVEPGAFICRVVESAHTEVFGAAPRKGSPLPAEAFASDASHMLQAGIPTVIYGPGNWVTAPNVGISVQDLGRAAEVYARAAAVVASTPREGPRRGA